MNSVLRAGRQPGFVGAIGNRADDAVRRYVAALLGIGSGERLAASLIERASLSGGRVEAYEFGRDQHSSAAAGAVLAGMASIPTMPNDVLAPLFRSVAGLVRLNGAVTGHDGDHAWSTSSWSVAQVLFGLLVGARRLDFRIPRLHKMVTALVRLQDADSGGWPLRTDEPPRPAFSVYPSLALAEIWRSGLERSDRVARSLAGAADYLSRCLQHSAVTIEELILALRALTIVRQAVGTDLITTDLDLSATADSLRDRAWSPRHGILLKDLPVLTYSQPSWHMTLWRPLFWLAIRGEASPLSPLDSLLAHELVAAFHHDIRAWRGPDEAGARNGASWPSALALAGTYLLAADLVRHDITVDQWLNRCRELRNNAFEFDVGISFAKPDRAIASEINAVLRRAGYRVFYDADQQHRMLGEDIALYLQDVYLRRCRYAIVIVTSNFSQSTWAGNWEWPAMVARMQSQRGAYVLPYVVDGVSLPGLNPTIGFATLDQVRPWEFAQLVVRKLRTLSDTRDPDG